MSAIFDILRLAVYGICFLAAGKGLIDFDMASGMIDPKPFTVDTLLTGIAGVGNAVAAVAWFKGWSGKKGK